MSTGKAFTPIHFIFALAITCFVFGAGFLTFLFLFNKNKKQKNTIKSMDFIVKEATAYQQTLEFIKTLPFQLDAIIVCGGGRPSTPSSPPLYVQSRCDISVLLYNHSKQHFGKKNLPKILCVSAGTAHTPLLLHKSTKLPVWESYSSAKYILNKYASFVERTDVFMETISYDSIGNAYFAKILFADVLQWKNIAVITNDWHFKRTKAIFEWIYSIKHNKYMDNIIHNMVYVSVQSNKNKDLSKSARNDRMEREEKSLKNVYKLKEKYNTLNKVHRFLFTEHSMYACCKSDENDNKEKVKDADERLMAAYGFKDKMQQELIGDNVTEMFDNIQKRYKNDSASKEKIADL
eukprot:517389_1